MIPTEVISLEKLGPNGYWLTVKRPFDFIPGQVVKLTTSSTIAPRLYSIASGNNEPHLSFLFDLKSEGELTPQLIELKPGETILISPAFGEFICKESSAIWVASGTGIAPYLSMAKSGLSKGKQLIHGVRYHENFFFHDELERLLGERYIKCCSGSTVANMFEGRVTEYLQKATNLPLDRKYYLCGNPEMVVDTREVLLARGVAYENILAEIYF
ncbi:ferredoxin--NADP reductase [Williamwhitmania taraxaci]|uniref:Ferredoxin--NADP+ reductase n=1 Tax=Williamwhitmania taraxaci TaxID=1640674 RepID=A0A1G6QVS6_9BACT|nr:oxidoreductase [Williamwhitmania taraxaci]SDC96044.1 ferredoxin--NADP+ reductase [Williamwhitmania taraxaci]